MGQIISPGVYKLSRWRYKTMGCAECRDDSKLDWAHRLHFRI